MSNTFKLSIKTPLKEEFNQEVLEFQIDTELGRMSVLPKHASLTGSVVFSKATIKFDNTIQKYFIKNGILFVDPNENTTHLLCLSCENVSKKTL